MSTVSLTHLSEKPLSEVLTLAKWYRIENTQLTVSDKIPSRQSGLFISVFGEQLKAIHLEPFLMLAVQHDVNITAVCCYQPDSDLSVGLALHSSQQLSDSALVSFRTALRELAGKHSLQASCIADPAYLEEPGLLVMDMDSTAITIECIDEIARLADVYDEVAQITAGAMLGQLGFKESLYQRVGKLAGIELSLIQALKDDLPLMPGIQQLCHTLKKHHWHLVIASGGFTWFAQALQAPLQLDGFYANELDIVNDKLTGKVIGDVVDAQKKADILISIRNELGLLKAQTVAIGDGANDLLMMKEAGTGIAVHGKPKVVAQADAAICQGSLLQVLYLLGIPGE